MVVSVSVPVLVSVPIPVPVLVSRPVSEPVLTSELEPVLTSELELESVSELDDSEPVVPPSGSTHFFSSHTRPSKHAPMSEHGHVSAPTGHSSRHDPPEEPSVSASKNDEGEE